MRTTSLIIALLLGATAMAQKEKDTTRVFFGDRNIIITQNGDTDTIKRKFSEQDKDFDLVPLSPFAHWAGLEFGINGLIGSNYSFNLPEDAANYELDYAKSWFVNLNIFEARVNFYKHYIGMVTGLGFSFNNYAFNRPTVLLSDPDQTWTFLDTTKDFTTNKFKAIYLTVPLLIEINSNRKASKSFHFAFGVIGGLRIGSSTVQRYAMMNSEFKLKQKSNFNLNPIRAQATARIGFGPFSAFMNYSFTQLFKNNKAPEMYPVEFGVGLYLP